MIRITIDHNQDLITVTNSDFPKTGKMEFKIFKSSTVELRRFMIELLNMMDLSEITLEEIDEDIRKTVEEW